MKMRSAFFVKAVQVTYPEPSLFILLSHVGYWKISAVPDQKNKQTKKQKKKKKKTKEKKKRTNIYEITREAEFVVCHKPC